MAHWADKGEVADSVSESALSDTSKIRHIIETILNKSNSNGVTLTESDMTAAEDSIRGVKMALEHFHPGLALAGGNALDFVNAYLRAMVHAETLTSKQINLQESLDAMATLIGLRENWFDTHAR